MQNFLQFLPLLECIQLSIEIIRKQEKAQIQLRKGLVYPLCLLFGAGAGILLFNRTVLPAMLRLMSGFPMQDASFYLVQKVVEWILEAGMYCLSVFVFLLYVCTRRSRIVHTYCLCAKHGKNSLFVQYVSYQFVQYYEEFVKKKISTRRSIEILKCMKTQPVIVFLAEEMEKKFLSGETFQQTIESVYIEDTLARFFKVAVYSSKVEEMLEGYLHLCQTRIEKQIRQFTRVVQIISYTMIGILIVFVYRILMLPMTMLQNI